MNIESAYTEYIITQRLRGNSEKTIIYYTNCITPLIRYLGEKTETSDLTAKQIREYAEKLKSRDISSNSFKTYLKGIKAYLSWLYSEEYTKTNLSKKIALPKAQRKTIDTLTSTEIQTLFKSFNIKTSIGLRNYCICALMLDSGLRKSEIVRLQISDIHIAEGYLIVNGKGNKQRIVPMGNNSQKHIIKYIAQRPCNIKTESLFLTQKEKPITQDTIAQLFKRIQTHNVIGDHMTKRIHAHLLRHTFATLYLENGGNIYSLQQILGHTSLEMVKRYVHLTQAKTVVNFKNFSPLDNVC